MCRAPCGHFHLLFHLIFTTIPWHETNLPLGQSLPETKSNLIPLAALPQAQVSLAVKGIFAPVFSGPTLSSLVFPHVMRIIGGKGTEAGLEAGIRALANARHR